MRIFRRLYDLVIRLSGNPKARWWLAGVSFTESSFFLIPPDVMLMPMSIAQPKQWLYLAGLTTITSVLGGMFGYWLGYLLLDAVLPIVKSWGYLSAYESALSWFMQYGIWAVLLAGFTPIPYKIFTIASGAFGVFFVGFILMSFLGRGARFFLVAWACATWGGALADRLYKYFDWIGWLLVLMLAVIIILK